MTTTTTTGSPKPAPPRKSPNVRRTPYGFQLYTRIRGQFVSEHWKGTIPPTALEVRDWKHLQHAKIKHGATTADDIEGETLADDIARYLDLIATMPTLRWRKDDLALWLAVFGEHRIRTSITSAEIRAQLERWRTDGYAPSTVNHRRTALMHLWSVLDGKSAPNPAKDAPRYRDESRPPSPLSPKAIDAILAAMPDGPMKARAVLMRWTGWPQAQIMRLTPEHIRWNEAVFISRKKGHGVAGRWLPLLPDAWTALKRFAKLKAWGTFDAWRLRSAFRRAAARARRQRLPKAIRRELEDVTPYQLRHSFGTLIAGVTQDDRAVMTLMIHSDIRQTHRYTGVTVDSRAAAAVASVSASLRKVSCKSGCKSGRKRQLRP